MGETHALRKLFIVQPTRETSESGIEACTEAHASSPSNGVVAQIVNPKFEQWVTVHLLQWLYNSMKPTIAIQLMSFNNAKDLWEATQISLEWQV